MKLLRIKTIVCSNEQVMVYPSLVEFDEAKKEYERAQKEGLVGDEMGEWDAGVGPALAGVDSDETLFTIMSYAGQTPKDPENGDLYLPKITDPDADDKALQIVYHVL